MNIEATRRAIYVLDQAMDKLNLQDSSKRLDNIGFRWLKHAMDYLEKSVANYLREVSDV